MIHHQPPPRATYATPCSTGPLDPFARFGGGVDGSFAPAFELREEADRFELEADIPAVEPSAIEIFLNGNVLTIRGERSVRSGTQQASYLTYERSFGRFWRAFRLPAAVMAAGARANLSNGVLSLILPKRAAGLAS